MAPAGCWRDRFARVLDKAVAGAMRQGKTQQLCALENLRATYFRYGDGSTDCNAYNKLSLLHDLTENWRRAEAIIEQLRDHFVFDIDQDVDYEEWGKPETWVPCATASPRGKKTSKEEQDEINHWMMEELTHRTKSGSSGGSEELQVMVSMCPSAIEHGGVETLDAAVRDTLTKFRTALREIGRVIYAKHDSAYYKRIFHDQRIHYEKTISQDVNDAYSAWKDQHLDNEIGEEALREHKIEAMEDLFQANVFDGIKDGAGRKKREAYRREVCFDECDRSKAASYDKAYACFREVFDYRDGEYVIDKVKAGKLVFKIRKDPDKVKAFFWFVQTMALIDADIDEIHGRQRVESVCDGVDFCDLRSRFSEAQVKASGIKNHADIVLALIDRMQREDIPKSHWIVFYCELVRRGWIGDNLAAFCKSMKAIFGVNLDHRALSRNMKNLGDDIDLWPEEDDRQRKKKAFGQDFRKLVEAYIKYKRHSILSDVEKLVPLKSHFDTTK